MFYVDISQLNHYDIRYGQGQDQEEAIRSALINLFPQFKSDLQKMELGYDIKSLEILTNHGYDYDFVLKQSDSAGPVLDVSHNVVLVQCSPIFPGHSYWSVDSIVYDPTADDIIKNCILLARPKIYVEWLNALTGVIKRLIEKGTNLGNILLAYTGSMDALQASSTFRDFSRVYQAATDLLPVLAMKDGAGKLKFNGVFLARKPRSFYPLQFLITKASKLEAVELLNLVRLFENTDNLEQLLNFFNFYKNRIQVT